MKLKVLLKPSEEGGYTAIVPALPGCISEGDTKEEALRYICCCVNPLTPGWRGENGVRW